MRASGACKLANALKASKLYEQLRQILCKEFLPDLPVFRFCKLNFGSKNTTRSIDAAYNSKSFARPHQCYVIKYSLLFTLISNALRIKSGCASERWAISI